MLGALGDSNGVFSPDVGRGDADGFEDVVAAVVDDEGNVP